MKASWLPEGAFAWRLEAAVWTRQTRDGEDMICRPRLHLVACGWDTENEDIRTLGFIEFDQGGRREGRASWLVYHYPKDSNLRGHYDQTNNGFVPKLNEGEKCDPRPSAKDALKHLLQVSTEQIPPAELAALTMTSEVFLPVLQKVTDAYVRRQ